MTSNTATFDYVVVGAGAAGCVVASRLSEDPQLRVLLVEAGSGSTTATSDFPPAWPALLASSQNWGGAMSIQAATGTTPHIGRGKGIGGSTAINAMIFARGHRDSYADWADGGAKGWTYDDLLPYFKRIETAAPGHGELRGDDGPLTVAPARVLHAVPEALLSAAVNLGYPRAIDVSGGQEIGFGPVDLTIADGRRLSAADAYLGTALSRPNLNFVSDALVHRVRVAGHRAIGIEYSIGRSVSTVTAGEVILCAGAIGTPQVLMLSGIGPAAHLREVGVEVVYDLPGVGSNFQDHPLSVALWRAARPVPYSKLNHGEVIGLLRSDVAETAAPDIQLVFVENLVGAQPEAPNHFGMLVSALQPHSRGTVRLAANDPTVLPLVDPDFLGDTRDLAVLTQGVRAAHEIGNASALDSWRAEELIPGQAVADPEALRVFVKASVGSYYHPAGTCAMGDTVDAVVDGDLRMHGIDNLRVIDASVMPSLPSNNTVATVYAIAELGADLISGR